MSWFVGLLIGFVMFVVFMSTLVIIDQKKNRKVR